MSGKTCQAYIYESPNSLVVKQICGKPATKWDYHQEFFCAECRPKLKDFDPMVVEIIDLKCAVNSLRASVEWLEKMEKQRREREKEAKEKDVLRQVIGLHHW